MKKILPALFRRFDARLAADLKRQRRAIAAGLACAIISSLLATGLLVVVRLAVAAVSDAGNLSEQKIVEKSDTFLIAKDLGRSQLQVSEALAKIDQKRRPDGKVLEASEVASLAKLLDKPVDEVQRSVTSRLDSGHNRTRQKPMDAIARLGLVSLGVIALYGIRYWFTRGQTYYLSYAASRLANDLRMRLFAKLQRLPVTYFNERRAGAIQSVLTNDVGVYQSAVGILRDTIDAPIKSIGALGVIIYCQWQLAVVAVLFMPPMAIAIQRNARKMRLAQAKVQDDLANVSAMTQESLQGVRVIKAFSAEATVQTKYGQLVESSFQSQIGAARRVAALRPLVEFLGALAIAATIYICGWLAYWGSLQVADIAALILGLDQINQGFRSLGNVNNTYSQVQAASDRIYSEVLDVPDEHGDEHEGVTIAKPRGQIEFREVSFSYPDGTEALRNVSFTLEPGTSLALVGPSGAGKSTIADLVLRFYEPTEGQILFDGTDLREISKAWLRSQIGVVPQATFLFAGTIAENMLMGAPEATASDIEEAGRMAHVDDFVSPLPERYNHPIGEGGAGLSGGQKQRVAIARAVIRKPTLLLLDEATSALDATSEKVVTEALQEIMQTRTTLFIAHRLTTAARANRILYLRRGEVIEVGSHRELMDKNGEYAALFRVFSGGVMDEFGSL